MKDDMTNAARKRWNHIIAEAYETGTMPSYDLLEEAVCDLMNENRDLRGIVTSMAEDFAKVIAPRIAGLEDDCVISAVDQFIGKRSLVKPAMESTH